ncbi:lactonase family protein [Phytohabitans sp. ZYX-F-186]|uniref:Lactonase family protein n=1 Tax=Phytohabitans maris TaxID=3071409 RepID=A0ABU0ZLG7_9ACTN|nr:lactonase family protein [Phytohabitans sp. ZYX-F-186]MDQ7907855.1 lactonase family protein [Phytohabitans sp. ZYX-F-186]
MSPPTAQPELLYVGCYTPDSGGEGAGITAVRRDPATGLLESLGVVARTPSPSFLAWHPTLPVLYAVNEVEEGGVSAWAVDGETDLRPLGQGSTGGMHPCHLAVAPGGGYLVSVNYSSGSVAVHRLGDDGALGERTDLLAHEGAGPDPKRQERAHAHMASPNPGGGAILVVDLGTDSVYRYELEAATGRLVPLGPRIHAHAGSGPRHLARHPDGRRAYLVGELDATVTAYDIEGGAGVLHERGRVATTRLTGAQPSEIAVRADGRFLYVANRGTDTISAFALDGDVPVYLAEIPTGGRWPRHFALVGDHLYVANERSHAVVGFHLDADSGVPQEPGSVLELPSPTCVLPAKSL